MKYDPFVDQEALIVHLEEVMALYRKRGIAGGSPQFYQHWATFPWNGANIVMQAAYWRESLAIHREFNALSWIASVLNALGELALWLNEYDRAEAFYLECRRMGQKSGFAADPFPEPFTCAYVALHQGDDLLAATRFKESLKFAQAEDQITQFDKVLICLSGFAAVMAYRGEAEAAACAYGTFAAELERLQAEPEIVKHVDRADRLEIERYQALCRAQLDEEAFAAAWERGRTMELDQAIEQALQVVG